MSRAQVLGYRAHVIGRMPGPADLVFVEQVCGMDRAVSFYVCRSSPGDVDPTLQTVTGQRRFSCWDDAKHYADELIGEVRHG